jgi:hypothetical protein
MRIAGERVGHQGSDAAWIVLRSPLACGVEPSDPAGARLVASAIIQMVPYRSHYISCREI